MKTILKFVTRFGKVGVFVGGEQPVKPAGVKPIVSYENVDIVLYKIGPVVYLEITQK